MLAHGVQAERSHQPERLAMNEPANVLAANERDVLAELRPVELDQTVPMPALFGRHVRKDAGRRGIALAQPLRELVIDPLVLLLERDGEREDLLLRQVREVFHREGAHQRRRPHVSPSPSRPPPKPPAIARSASPDSTAGRGVGQTGYSRGCSIRACVYQPPWVASASLHNLRGRRGKRRAEVDDTRRQ
jgi:hypothetical protein